MINPEMEAMVERVAEAMWRQESIRAARRERLVPRSEANPEIANAWRDNARTVLSALNIEVLLAEERERCAKVAEAYGSALVEAVKSSGLAKHNEELAGTVSAQQIAASAIAARIMECDL